MARQAKTWMLKSKHHQPHTEIDLKSIGPVDVDGLLASIKNRNHVKRVLRPATAVVLQEPPKPKEQPIALPPTPAIVPARPLAQSQTGGREPIRAPNGRLLWKHATLNEKMAILQRNFPALARFSSVEMRNHILSGKADAQLAKAGELWDAGKLN